MHFVLFCLSTLLVVRTAYCQFTNSAVLIETTVLQEEDQLSLENELIPSKRVTSLGPQTIYATVTLYSTITQFLQSKAGTQTVFSTLTVTETVTKPASEEIIKTLHRRAVKKTETETVTRVVCDQGHKSSNQGQGWNWAPNDR